MRKTNDFFSAKIWNIRLDGLSPYRAFQIQLSRILAMTVKFFIRNRCTLHATSLTYFTVLSLAPVGALFFGIAKGYGFDRVLKAKIQHLFSSQGETASQIIRFAENALENASGGIVAGVGIILLLWSALKLLSNIEQAFNEIWGVRQGRSIARRISDYITLLLLCPLLFILLATSTTFIMSHLQNLAGYLPFSMLWNTVLIWLTNLFPFILAGLMFTLMYLFIPNTHVDFRAALTAGIFTGILYILLQCVYICAQKYLTGYNAIYGSFAAIPFLLIWLQLSWSLILLGAQIAFAVQNVQMYDLTPLDEKPDSLSSRARAAIRIMAELTAAFKRERGPVALPELSKKLEIPIRLTRSILYDLCAAGLTARLVPDARSSEFYQLAVPAERITPVFIFRRLTAVGYAGFQTPSAGQSEEILEALWDSAEHSDANRLPQDGNGLRTPES